MKRDFRLAPPDSVSCKSFDRGRDVSGNTTGHYALSWSNGLTGEARESGCFSTNRRVQVGCGDKYSDGAIGLCLDLFPGACWTVDRETATEGRDGARFTLKRDFNNQRNPVIFREDRESGDIVAFFPWEFWTNDPDSMTCYAHIGQHGGATVGYYRQNTRPANGSLESGAIGAMVAELTGQGYKLDVRKRLTPLMNETRAARLYAAGSAVFSDAGEAA